MNVSQWKLYSWFKFTLYAFYFSFMVIKVNLKFDLLLMLGKEFYSLLCKHAGNHKPVLILISLNKQESYKSSIMYRPINEAMTVPFLVFICVLYSRKNARKNLIFFHIQYLFTKDKCLSLIISFFLNSIILFRDQ